MYSNYNYITAELLNNIEQRVVEATTHVQQYFTVSSYTPKTWVLNERVYTSDIAHIENQIKILGDALQAEEWITNKTWEDGQLLTLSYQDFNRWEHDLNICVSYAPITPPVYGFVKQATLPQFIRDEIVSSIDWSAYMDGNIYYWGQGGNYDDGGVGYLGKYDVNTKETQLTFQGRYSDIIGYTGSIFLKYENVPFIHLYCGQPKGDGYPDKSAFRINLKTNVGLNFGTLPYGMYGADAIEYNEYLYFLNGYEDGNKFFRMPKVYTGEYQDLEPIKIRVTHGSSYNTIIPHCIGIYNGRIYCYLYNNFTEKNELYSIDLNKYVEDGELDYRREISDWKALLILNGQNPKMYGNNIYKISVKTTTMCAIYKTDVSTLIEEEILEFDMAELGIQNINDFIICEDGIYLIGSVSDTTELYKYISE